MRRSDPCGYEAGLESACYLRRRKPNFPRVGIILGSGLGEVTDRLGRSITIPYRRIPNFPRSDVKGHAGKLHVGAWEDLPVAVLEGRVHLYEGHTPQEVVFPVRVLGLAGVETLILTCAAGGIASRATPGSLMIFSDHLNFQGSSPLAAPLDKRWGPRFLDLSAAYDAQLRRTALKSAKALRLKCFEGIYAADLGPNYETPAEVRALKRLGADAIGMSTVPEAIAARQMNMHVLAIAAITNRAAGLSKRPLGHQEVLEAGEKSSRDFIALLDRVLASLVGPASRSRR